MTSKERFLTVLNKKIPDRVPMFDGFWSETISRWRKEGMPENADVYDFFGLDKIGLVYFDDTLQYKERIIEETDEYVIKQDKFGATVKSWKNSDATPLHIEWDIKNRNDWFRVKESLKATEDRISEPDKENYDKCKRENIFTVLCPTEPFWFVLQKALGFEGTLALIMDERDLIEDMLATYTEFTINMCEIWLGKGMKFDGLWFASDLCYKNGMLFSPSVYREIVMPYHKKVSSFLKSNKMSFLFHCDGDVRKFIPFLIGSGVDCIQPLEVRCGNDVRELKKQYGNNIVLWGNISVDAMAAGKKEIENEVKTKLEIAKQNGGYMYHSDHSIPPTVSLENYGYVVELVKKYGIY